MRINCIDVRFLADQHLVAEWCEMLMLPNYISRSLNVLESDLLIESVSNSQSNLKYTLNKGHAKFFYNKLDYIISRYEEIRLELLRRGLQANPKLDLTKFKEINPRFFQDWSPTKDDKLINLERIEQRISIKPEFYTWYREKVEDWVVFYRNYKLSL